MSFPKEGHKRGCTCEDCQRRRKNSRDYAARAKLRKLNGEAPPPQPTKKMQRLVETPAAVGVQEHIVHWLPDDVEVWRCPVCEQEFVIIEGAWAAVE